MSSKELYLNNFLLGANDFQCSRIIMLTISQITNWHFPTNQNWEKRLLNRGMAWGVGVGGESGKHTSMPKLGKIACKSAKVGKLI